MYLINKDITMKAIKYLKKDIYDDWYCDLQNFEDIHSKIDKLVESINGRIISGNGVYKSNKCILFNIPKGNCGFRYTLEMDYIDRHSFHIFGYKLINLLDKCLPFNILGHRKSDNDKMLYKPMIEQWNKFINFTKIRGEKNYIIEVDIANYYDNINLNLLKKELIAAAADSELESDNYIKCMYLIESIISLLKNISYDGIKGLPQNRDISSFLANIYMRGVDKCLSENIYFRYMDDIKIIAESKHDINKIMLKLTETLRHYGLSLNTNKTKILEPGTEQHKEFCFDSDFELQKIDTMLNSKKKKYVLESFQEIYKKNLEYLENKNINDRKFRFYSNRLITFLLAKDIKVPDSLKTKIAEKLIGCIDERPDCADKICELALGIGPNKKLHRDLINWATNIHNITFEWAVYSIIKTLSMQKCKSKKLSDFCKKTLSDNNNSDPLRGISAIYLNEKSKTKIMDIMSLSNSFFLQRYLIISLSSIDPKKLITNKTSNKIIPDLKGLHPILNKKYNSGNFSYIKESERLIHKELIREMRNYV